MLRGISYEASSYADMLIQVLREIALKDHGFLERFSRIRARKRRYVARNQQDLYQDRPDLGNRFSSSVVDGWWVGTNYNRKEILSILEKVCKTANIEYGIDFIPDTSTKTVDRGRAFAFVGIGHDPDPTAAGRHDELFAQAILNAKP